MGYKRISDYGLIGDGATVALVGRDGAIDWMCLPYLDSPSVFAALLDHRHGGCFAVRPLGDFDSAQHYLDRTNVLETRFRTPHGELELVDLMPEGGTPGRLLRRARAVSGTVELELECSARFDYARARPSWSRVSERAVTLRADGAALSLLASRPLEWRDERARLSLAEGETLWLALVEGESGGALPEEAALERAMTSTCEYWRAWVRSSRTGRYPTSGFWERLLDRSALVLKLLQVRSTGAIAAAATTSLPAIVHGERNWDYRFSWIRDASMTVAALFRLGHHDEAESYLGWLRWICAANPGGELAIVYRLREPAPPGDETSLEHLSGYKGSAPVRVGQFVVNQRQHDIYGELLETLFVVSHYTGKINTENWEAFRPLVEQAARIWRGRDDGIWEARIGEQHYTHSKLMCWVAIDRGIKIAEHYGFEADLERWRVERDAIRADILERGYDADRNTFTQHYDTDQVDAALLLIPLSGFLPADDRRVTGTIRAIEQDLLDRGVLMRYVAPDGLQGQEAGFLICFFWYLECLLLQGRLDEVDDWLRAISRYASPLGLFGEQYDPRYREITGNFPQAYSHIGYVSVLLKYLDARREMPETEPLPWMRRIALLWRRELLNAPRTGKVRPRPAQPAAHLMRTMNVLRGQFYDGHAQRVYYELIRGSEYYRTFREAADALADYDVSALAGDDDRIAFWVNVYNAIVIHGVIHLGIRSSVREVPRFFDRIAYRVGGQALTADDIEHGILRGNRVPLWSLKRPFGGDDPRLGWVVRNPDPRIHFALVCASKTCPPVEAYDAASLDHQLETSAAVFINGSTRFDPASRTLSVSEIFKWYGADFGRDEQALARYIASYLYDERVRLAIEADDAPVRLDFLAYDWRLNR